MDLSEWAGETVTLTLEIRQESGEPVLEFVVDEVALGAWLTPVINAVSPAQMDPGSNEIFTITGENFLDPVVRLGNVQLDQVTWLDEHTLLASLPGNDPARGV